MERGPSDALIIMCPLHILIVDDDIAARTAIGSLLRQEGFEVEVAEDGAAALEAVARRCPDLVLTDLQMPGIDGIELCRALRERAPDLPVIVTTGFGDTRSAVRAMREGATDYLQKPLDLDAVLLSIQDAIERRAARIEQARLRLRNDELYHAAVSAVRAHEDIVSIVSHDLRNPLGIITLQAHLLELDASFDQQAVQRILRAAASMDYLIKDLLDESRIRGGHLHLERALHDVADLLADVSELRPLALQKGIRLVFRASAEDLAISCDRRRVSQVLDNLVTNAIKFIPKGGTVTISAAPCDAGVRFEVHDDGAGIALEALPHIFDRFWQAKDRHPAGAGLGLFIAKGIVDAHGGRIWVESQLGVGSTFYVELPLSPPPAAATAR
jgi:signal transduction histidine kinase